MRYVPKMKSGRMMPTGPLVSTAPLSRSGMTTGRPFRASFSSQRYICRRAATMKPVSTMSTRAVMPARWISTHVSMTQTAMKAS
jgi:hypothetical protein